MICGASTLRLLTTKFLKFPPVTCMRLLLKRQYAASVPGSNIPINVPNNELVNEKSEMLQKIEIENLPRAQQRFAKEFEEINFLRIKEIFKKNKKNIFGFVFIMSGVIGIYYYTMYAVKQETFLEEIDQEVSEEKGEVKPAVKT